LGSHWNGFDSVLFWQGFDEYTNLVLDEDEEIALKKKTHKPQGQSCRVRSGQMKNLKP
jgi:small nuclear ribonucleoprotein (snRNP)-like protein